MLFQPCWRCFSRPPVRSLQSHWRNSGPAVSFATSATIHANPVRRQTKGLSNDIPQRGVKANFSKKKKQSTESKGKRPEPGERKAMRKRVVLSNANALEVEGMQDLTAESIVDTRLRAQVIGITGPIIDQLRAVNAFKPTQGWGLFRRPGMLIRQETVQFGELFEEMSGEGVKKTIRRILVGEKGSGKTTMLLQAMTMAFLKDWVVINIPDAQDIVIGHCDYGPIPQTSPMLYAQKSYTASLLTSISRANPILAELNLSSPPSSSSTPTPIPIPIPSSISLSRLALLGSQDPESAPQILQLLLQELSLPGRPRLLLCIDGLAHVMKDSAYKTSGFKPIHAHDLAIVRWFMDHLSGTTPLPNGGMVLAATSHSNAPSVPTLDLALAELEESQSRPSSSSSLTSTTTTSIIPMPYKPALRNPFATYDARVLSVFEFRPEGLEVQRLAGLTKEETRGLLEYWARSGVLREKVSDVFVGEKWTLSGGGVIGELERATVRMRIR